MHSEKFKEKQLTSALVSIVNNTANGDLSVENIRRILNNSGITRDHGISSYYMLEALALILYELNIGRADKHLRKVLIYFIADYPVFTWQELRYTLTSDPVKEIEQVLHELRYKCREIDIDGVTEYVWSSRWVTVRAARKKLKGRDRAGDPEFYKFLNFRAEG